MAGLDQRRRAERHLARQNLAAMTSSSSLGTPSDDDLDIPRWVVRCQSHASTVPFAAKGT